MNIDSFIENPQFYGRRRGRKLSKSGQLAIKDGKDLLIKIFPVPPVTIRPSLKTEYLAVNTFEDSLLHWYSLILQLSYFSFDSVLKKS